MPPRRAPNHPALDATRERVEDYIKRCPCARCVATVHKKHRRCHKMVHYGDRCWQHARTKYHVHIEKSRIRGAGKGLFSTQPMKEGTAVASYHGTHVTPQQADRMSDARGAYLLTKHDGTIVDAINPHSCLGRFVNHPQGGRAPVRANAKIAELPGGKAVMTLTKDVGKHTEIIASYGGRGGRALHDPLPVHGGFGRAPPSSTETETESETSSTSDSPPMSLAQHQVAMMAAAAQHGAPVFGGAAAAPPPAPPPLPRHRIGIVHRHRRRRSVLARRRRARAGLNVGWAPGIQGGNHGGAMAAPGTRTMSLRSGTKKTTRY